MTRRVVSPDDIDTAVDVLRAGGVVAYATDTLYGLAVDPRLDGAVEKLFAAKGRPAGTAVPLIAATIEQAQEAGTFGPVEARLAAAFWPGPLSIVVRADVRLSRRLLGSGDTVAVRVPAHPVARRLAQAFGFCITSTSANPTGAPAPVSAAQVTASLGERVDLIVDSGAAPGGPPSTIVIIDETGPVLVRAGAIAWDRVLRSLQ
jgi:L-threonylcarbamoyladenylate synthase